MALLVEAMSDQERQQAEFDFVEAAYDAEEAWISNGRVHRRLGDDLTISFHFPDDYPSQSALVVEGSASSKTGYDALPRLLEICRAAADDQLGEEALFVCFAAADEWLLEEYPKYQGSVGSMDEKKTTTSNTPEDSRWGRRLIYSHHIISTIKRRDLAQLAKQYQLTGYVKIGWPGIILIEGWEEDCISFYDDIRRWNWKYLVVRGEMQEETRLQLFNRFEEVDDMSVVADACRNVGLEALFRTSMKVYENDEESKINEHPYAALIHVHHMNDDKGYRKWLRRTCEAADVSLLVRQFFPADDPTKWSLIYVAFVGDQADVAGVLKRWRTTRIDVTHHGKPCLERMMRILWEGTLERAPSGKIDWEAANAEENVNTTKEELCKLLAQIGGETWIHLV